MAEVNLGPEVQTVKLLRMGKHRLHHVTLRKGVGVEEAIAKYRNNPAIEYAEPNYVYHFSGIPNDPLFTQLWGPQLLDKPFVE